MSEKVQSHYRLLEQQETSPLLKEQPIRLDDEYIRSAWLELCSVWTVERFIHELCCYKDNRLFEVLDRSKHFLTQNSCKLMNVKLNSDRCVVLNEFHNTTFKVKCMR